MALITAAVLIGIIDPVGYVSALRGEDISETAVRADTMMMEEKRKYYQINGIDRRRASR